MYLHFEDWSDAPSVGERLKALGFPQEQRVIKVFACPKDIRQSLGKSALTVMEADGNVFSDVESYTYEHRRTYTGPELEQDLGQYELDADAASITRSLFRFSNEHGFCQAAMALKKKATWAIRHPYQSIDGIAVAQKRPSRRAAIHLDIFLPDSLRLLEAMAGLENPDSILNWHEGVRRLSTEL